MTTSNIPLDRAGKEILPGDLVFKPNEEIFYIIRGYNKYLAVHGYPLCQNIINRLKTGSSMYRVTNLTTHPSRSSRLIKIPKEAFPYMLKQTEVEMYIELKELLNL